MAELENACCAPAAQATCCEPEDKADCCGDRHSSGCGCSAGASTVPGATATVEQVRETVREKYAAAAQAASAGSSRRMLQPGRYHGRVRFGVVCRD